MPAEYDAFISYRRSDGAKVARWLRRELQSFKPPRSLRDTFGRKLRVYLDTAYERGTSDFYEQNIQPALLASHYLLVVATPDAAQCPEGQEDWIVREVEDFSRSPNAGNVIAIRAAGEFDAPLPGNLNSLFPNIEIVDLRGAGRLWFLHPTRAARLAAEKLKIVAPLLGIPPELMPQLRQEEERRQQTLLGAIAGGALAVLAVVSGLSVFALLNLDRAVRANQDGMYAAGGMALQAAAIESRDPAIQRVRQIIITQGCDLIDKFRAGADRAPQIAEAVMCQIERAKNYAGLKEQKKAREQLDEAIETAKRRYEKLGHVDAALALLRARRAYAEYDVKQNQSAAAETEYGKLIADAQKFSKAHPGRNELDAARSDALARLGDIHANHNEHHKAAASYEAAANALERVNRAGAAFGNPPAPKSIARLMRLHRQAGEELFELGEAGKAIDQYRHAIASARPDKSGKMAAAVEFELMLDQARVFDAEYKHGTAAAAAAAKSDVLKTVTMLIGSAQFSSTEKKKLEAFKNRLESYTVKK